MDQPRTLHFRSTLSFNDYSFLDYTKNSMENYKQEDARGRFRRYEHTDSTSRSQQATAQKKHTRWYSTSALRVFHANDDGHCSLHAQIRHLLSLQPNLRLLRPRPGPRQRTGLSSVHRRRFVFGCSTMQPR